MKTTTKLFLFGIVVALTIAVVGCGGIGNIGGAPTHKGTSLTINVGKVASLSKDINPPVSTLVSQFMISGTGPGGATFGPTNSSGNLVVNDLIAGTWNVLVVGQNSSGIPLGEGTGSGVVVIGQQTTISVTVNEYTGPGSFQLNITWLPQIVADPHFTGVLTDSHSVNTPMPITITAAGTDPGVPGAANSLMTGLANGWYAVVCQLFDGNPGSGGFLSTGFADVMRVLSGFQTVGNVDLHAIKGYSSIDVDVTLNMMDPLNMLGTPPQGTVTLAGSGIGMSVVEQNSVAFTGIWYLNGTPVGTGASYFVANGSNFRQGESYRLDGLFFATDGQRAGSAHWVVNVPAANADTTISGVITPTNFPIGDTITVEAFQYNVGLVSVSTYMVSSAQPFQYQVTNLTPGGYILKFVSQEIPGWVNYWHPGNGGMGTSSYPDSASFVIPTTGGVVANVTSFNN